MVEVIRTRTLGSGLKAAGGPVQPRPLEADPTHCGGRNRWPHGMRVAATRPTLARVASRLTIPTGFHIANATGVEATTEPMRETGHQDVSCQMPHADATNPARTASETSPSALPSIPVAGALEANVRFFELFNAEGVQALMNQMM